MRFIRKLFRTTLFLLFVGLAAVGVGFGGMDPALLDRKRSEKNKPNIEVQVREEESVQQEKQ